MHHVWSFHFRPWQPLYPISAGLGLVIALMPPLLHGSGGIDNHSRSYLPGTLGSLSAKQSNKRLPTVSSNSSFCQIDSVMVVPGRHLT
jgi:hypothetical protein